MRYDPRRHHLPACEISGILLVDKPATWTSFDVVNFIRSRFNVPKVGHCGTLDPAATGLLVLTLGSATKISGELSGDDKRYTGTMRFGMETDSGDLDGSVTSTCDASSVTVEAILTAYKKFSGEIMQLPPMVSAVKIGGKRLYELARKGIEIEREPRPITIKQLMLTAWRADAFEADFDVTCSKGAYVRVLAQDIGRELGVGGVLIALRRQRSGRFYLDDAASIDFIKTLDQDGFKDLVINQMTKIAAEKK